ncbi:MAG: retropepsin-like domain-containing protein [Treponema sp.]|nr:retropepsin-like domain-containing protein [Treponema sp.]
MGTNAVTVHLPENQRQAVIIEMQIGVPVPIDGYPKDRRIGMKSMALVDTGATGSCISRRFAEGAQLKSFKMGKIRGAHGVAVVPIYRVDVFLPNGILITNMDVAEFTGGYPYRLHIIFSH